MKSINEDDQLNQLAQKRQYMIDCGWKEDENNAGMWYSKKINDKKIPFYRAFMLQWEYDGRPNMSNIHVTESITVKHIRGHIKSCLIESIENHILNALEDTGIEVRGAGEKNVVKYLDNDVGYFTVDSSGKPDVTNVTSQKARELILNTVN